MPVTIERRYHGNGPRVTMQRVRRLVFCAVLLAGCAHASAQDQSTSAPAQAPVETAPPEQTTGSLERIRALLKKDPESVLLRQADLPTIYKIQIIEQQKLDELLSKLEIGNPGPRPWGGNALYEQSWRLFNPVDNPLMQPYAVFSPGELVDVSLKTLLFHFLGKGALKGVDALRDKVRESAAQREVDLAIAQFCEKRPDRSDIKLCNPDP
jgi:hypothetical protein